MSVPIAPSKSIEPPIYHSENCNLINKSIYYLKYNTTLYSLNGRFLGTSTKYKAISHNGKDSGSLEIMTNNNQLMWIKGYVYSPYKDGYKIYNFRFD